MRVTAEALSSGSVRLKHSTAERLIGHETLQDSTEASSDGPQALVLNPCPAQGFASPLYAQLRIVPTKARPSQASGASPPPPPSLHCELCGLGAWLRGQGAVPGVHWVQLWRGAEGILRLRLCDGKPTELPGKEAEAAAEIQQVIAVASKPTSATKYTGSSDAAAAPAASAEAAGAHAAATIVGPAAQAVADAAAPWQLHAPASRAHCMHAVVAWQVPARACQLGAVADAVESTACRPANGDRRGPLPMGQWRTSGSWARGPVAAWGAGMDCDGDAGCVGHSRPLSPPRATPRMPAQQAPQPAAQAAAPAFVGAPRAPAIQTTAAFGSAAAAATAATDTVFTVRITAVGGRPLGWLNTEALALWPEACQLHSRQAMAVTLHLVPDQSTTPKCHTAACWEDVRAQIARYDANRFALFGLGQADDVFSLWRDGHGAVWASQKRLVFMQGQQQQEEQQQQPQQIEGGGADLAHPSSAGILTGRASNRKISLRDEEVQGLLVQPSSHSQQLMPDWITVHVKLGAGGSNSRHEGAQRGQRQGSEFAVRLLCYEQAGRKPRWTLSSAGALLKALGVVDGDTVQLQYESDGRLVIWRAAQQLYRQQQVQQQGYQAAGTVPPASCPADSIVVGYRDGSRSRMDARVGAVRALWPELASQLACGQSAEVDVHPVVADAVAEALGPFRLTLQLRVSDGKPATWRLNGCGTLFRALGAQNGGAISMWRSPGDGRVMAGMQPRCGLQRGREEQQQGQQGQGQDAGQQQEQQPEERQGQQGDGSRRQPQRRARQEGLHRLYGDYVVQEGSDEEDREEDELRDDGGGGVEKWESGESEEWQEEGPRGPPGDGLSRPSKRARAAEGAAQQYGGPSAAQQHQMQPTACPAGSIPVGCKHRTHLDVRVVAVRALWPEAACQLACGQSAEVEVHPAVADAGGKALGPFRVVLKLHSWPTKPTGWRLNGCGPLFRALGAQKRDAIFMWRSPGDGRLMAGAQPRGGARGGGRRVQVGQRGAGPRAGGKAWKVYGEYEVHETTDEGEEELEDGEDKEETEEGLGGCGEDEEEEEEEEELDEVGCGREASIGAGLMGEGRAGQGSDAVGRGWGCEGVGLALGCGGDTEARVGEDEEEEEEEDPGVNWWAREVGGEFGCGEEGGEGEQDAEQV